MSTRQEPRHKGLRKRWLVLFLALTVLVGGCIRPTPTPVETLTPKPTETVSSPIIASPTVAAVPTLTPETTETPIITESVCTETAGRIFNSAIPSAELSEEMPVSLYLPACTGDGSGKTYPVVYLFHGIGGDQNQWPELGMQAAMDAWIAEGGAPFIVVMPNINAFNRWPDARFGRTLANDIVPWVEKHYPVKTEREARALGGLSRGANWALRLGLETPELFAKIGMHSMATEDAEINHWTRTLIGMDKTIRPLLFLDCGNNDKDLNAPRLFDLELTKAAIPHTWYMFSGYHDAEYWSTNLPIYLEWYGADW